MCDMGLLSCDSRFKCAITECICIFKVITLVWVNQVNYLKTQWVSVMTPSVEAWFHQDRIKQQLLDKRTPHQLIIIRSFNSNEVSKLLFVCEVKYVKGVAAAIFIFLGSRPKRKLTFSIFRVCRNFLTTFFNISH